MEQMDIKCFQKKCSRGYEQCSILICQTQKDHTWESV